MVQGSPIYGYLLTSAEVRSASHDTVVCTLPLDKQHINSKNILHGSVSCTIADWMGGLVIAARGPGQQRGVSVDIHTTYIASATIEDALWIEGKAEKVGGKLAYTTIKIFAHRKDAEPDTRLLIVQATHTKYVG